MTVWDNYNRKEETHLKEQKGEKKEELTIKVRSWCV